MIRRKAVQQPPNKLKGQESNTSKAQKSFIAEIESDLSSFLRGKKYETRTIKGNQYFGLASKDKTFVNIIKLTQKTKIEDVKLCFESSLAFKQAVSRICKDDFLQLLHENGGHESFLFFEKPKSVQYIKNALNDLDYTITKSDKNKNKKVIDHKTIIQIVYCLDLISQQIHADEKLEKINRMIVRIFTRGLKSLDFGLNSYMIEGKVVTLEDPRLILIYKNLVNNGSFFPHCGLTLPQLLNGAASHFKSLNDFLIVNRNPKKTNELKEIVAQFICRHPSSNIFYLNPEVITKK